MVTFEVDWLLSFSRWWMYTSRTEMWEGSSCRRSWTCPWRSSKLEEGEENKSDDGEEEEQSDKEDQGGED